MRWGRVARHNSSINAEKAVYEPLMPLWGYSAKGGVGLQSKGGVGSQGGVHLQGCGQFAKVGSNRNRGRNAKGVWQKRKRTAEAVLMRSNINTLKGSCQNKISPVSSSTIAR